MFNSRINLILLVFLLSLSLLGQKKEAPTFNSYHKNISFELLGSHFLTGVNFDMRLKKGQLDGIGFRAGIGGLSTNNISQGIPRRLGVVTFPLEFNHLVGKRRSSFVSGVGLLPIYATLAESEGGIYSGAIQAEGFGLAGGFVTFGYRFQPLRNGVMFQLNWNPLILRGSGFNMGWFGFSIGLGFK
jgi:hypothetical protein